MLRNDSYTSNKPINGTNRLSTSIACPRHIKTNTRKTSSLSGVGQLGRLTNAIMHATTPIMPMSWKTLAQRHLCGFSAAGLRLLCSTALCGEAADIAIFYQFIFAADSPCYTKNQHEKGGSYDQTFH